MILVLWGSSTALYIFLQVITSKEPRVPKKHEEKRSKELKNQNGNALKLEYHHALKSFFKFPHYMDQNVSLIFGKNRIFWAEKCQIIRKWIKNA